VSAAAARAGLEASIKTFEAGWNAHDADALARAFHAEASFVNRFGRLVHGRAAIAAMHAPLFHSVYRDSTMSCRIEEVDLLAEGAASGYVRFDLKTGDAMPGGPQDLPGRMLAVLAQSGAEWAVKAVTNVAMVDPMTGQPNANL
jgi:uncharacterized protein (TIGR02246 family)